MMTAALILMALALIIIVGFIWLIAVMFELLLPQEPSGDCPKCHDGVMSPLRSQFIKMCSSCNHTEPWDLKPGQKPLVTSNRDTRKKVE